MPAEPLPHLETFAEAAEAGSFTAAARALGVTQAAVSQRIQGLERDLGASLFRREGGRVSLTDAGRRLHSYARRILLLHAEAREKIGGQSHPVGGELSLAASSIPGDHLLPAILPAFHEKHPRIRVKVTVRDTQAVLDQVEHGQAQLGLVGGKGDSSHLEFRAFAHDEMVLVVPAGHALWRRKKVSLRELSGLPLVLREAGSGSRACLEQALANARTSLEDLQVVLELGSNESIKEAVLRGMGVAVLSSRVVEKDAESGRLKGLPVTGLDLRREMFAVWDRRRVLPIPARLFLDFLTTQPGV